MNLSAKLGANRYLKLAEAPKRPETLKLELAPNLKALRFVKEVGKVKNWSSKLRAKKFR